jgi:hypothetical protein
MARLYRDKTTGNVMYGNRAIGGPPPGYSPYGLPPVAPDNTFGLPVWAPQYTPEGRLYFNPPDESGQEESPFAEDEEGLVADDPAAPAAPAEPLVGDQPGFMSSKSIVGAATAAAEEAAAGGQAPAVGEGGGVGSDVSERGRLDLVSRGMLPTKDSDEAFVLHKSTAQVAENERRALDPVTGKAEQEVRELQQRDLEEQTGILRQQADVIKDYQRRALEDATIARAENDRRLRQTEEKVAEFGRMAIDPGRLYRNASTSHKISLGLSALAAGMLELRGFGKGNPVLDSMERAIERDIQSQIATAGMREQEIGMRGQLFRMGMEASGDKKAAAEAAKIIALEQLAKEAEAKGAQTASEIGRVQADVFARQVRIRVAENMEKFTKRQLVEQQEHEKFRTDIYGKLLSGELEKMRTMAAVAKARGAGGGAGKVRLPAGSAYDTALKLYGKAVVSPKLMVTNNNITAAHGDGFIVAKTEHSAKQADEAIIVAEGVMADIDQLKALLREHGKEVPWSEAKKRIEAIQARLVSAVRKTGEGALTNSDADRFYKQVGRGAADWQNFFNDPENAVSVLEDFSNSIVTNVNATLHSAGNWLGQSGRWTPTRLREDAALGKGATEKGPDRLRGALLPKVSLEKHLGESGKEVFESLTEDERKIAEDELLLEQSQTMAAKVKSSTKETAESLKKSVSDPEYHKAKVAAKELFSKAVDVLRDDYVRLAIKKDRTVGEDAQLKAAVDILGSALGLATTYSEFADPTARAAKEKVRLEKVAKKRKKAEEREASQQRIKEQIFPRKKKEEDEGYDREAARRLIREQIFPGRKK